MTEVRPETATTAVHHHRRHDRQDIQVAVAEATAEEVPAVAE